MHFPLQATPWALGGGPLPRGLQSLERRTGRGRGRRRWQGSLSARDKGCVPKQELPKLAPRIQGPERTLQSRTGKAQRPPGATCVSFRCRLTGSSSSAGHLGEAPPPLTRFSSCSLKGGERKRRKSSWGWRVPSSLLGSQECDSVSIHGAF